MCVPATPAGIHTTEMEINYFHLTFNISDPFEKRAYHRAVLKLKTPQRRVHV